MDQLGWPVLSARPLKQPTEDLWKISCWTCYCKHW